MSKKCCSGTRTAGPAVPQIIEFIFSKNGVAQGGSTYCDTIYPIPALVTNTASQLISKKVLATGYSKVVVGVQDTVAFTVRVMMAWNEPDTFVVVQQAASVADALTAGLQVADLEVPITRQLVQIRIDSAVAFAAGFRSAAYLVPHR